MSIKSKLLTITELAYELNSDQFTIIVTLYGHTNHLDVRVFAEGWEPYTDPTYARSVSIDDESEMKKAVDMIHNLYYRRSGSKADCGITEAEILELMNNAPFLAHRGRIMSELNTIDEAIEVLQAIKNGKAVQIFIEPHWSGTGFVEIIPAFHIHKYRVEPEPRRVWINSYEELDKMYRGVYTKIEDAKKYAQSGCLGQIEFSEVIK